MVTFLKHQHFRLFTDNKRDWSLTVIKINQPNFFLSNTIKIYDYLGLQGPIEEEGGEKPHLQ